MFDNFYKYFFAVNKASQLVEWGLNNQLNLNFFNFSINLLVPYKFSSFLSVLVLCLCTAQLSFKGAYYRKPDSIHHMIF